MGYIRDHWRGEHSLAWSFWVSFVLLSVITYAIQELTSRLIPEPHTLLYISLVEFVVFRVLIYPWQAVGVLRACERALQDYVPFYYVRPAQGIVLLGIIWVVVDGLGVLHVRNVAVDQAKRQQNLELSRQFNYSFELHGDGTLVHLFGPLDNGVTRDLEAFLGDHPAVQAIVLDSDGGSIYEGRGVARLIIERELATYSLSGCSSACATAFIGGSRRWLAPQARLGFHQYELQSRILMPDIDSAAELRKDFEQFALRGVDTEKLAPALSTPSANMWYPDHTLLLEAGVIHGIARPPGM